MTTMRMENTETFPIVVLLAESPGLHITKNTAVFDLYLPWLKMYKITASTVISAANAAAATFAFKIVSGR